MSYTHTPHFFLSVFKINILLGEACVSQRNVRREMHIRISEVIKKLVKYCGILSHIIRGVIAHKSQRPAERVQKVGF